MSGTKPLDLDALYGKDAEDKVFAVRWKGRVYTFRSRNEYGPLESIRLEEMYRRFRGVKWLTTKPKGMTQVKFQAQQQAMLKELEELIDGALTVICPDLAKVALPFNAKLTAFSEYFKQMRAEQKASSKNAKGGRQTGDESTPA